MLLLMEDTNTKMEIKPSLSIVKLGDFSSLVPRNSINTTDQPSLPTISGKLPKNSPDITLTEKSLELVTLFLLITPPLLMTSGLENGLGEQSSCAED